MVCVSKNGGTPIPGVFVMENPVSKWIKYQGDLYDLGHLHFRSVHFFQATIGCGHFDLDKTAQHPPLNSRVIFIHWAVSISYQMVIKHTYQLAHPRNQ